MKKMKLVIMAGVLMTLCFGLVSCILPEVVPDDPVQDVIEADPVASFSYTSREYPVQTGSWVIFDGSGSYDFDGEIVWGEWDFGDGKVVSGQWTEVIQKIVNGVEVFETTSIMCEQDHKYKVAPWDQDPPLSGRRYAVTLTVLDNDGNISSVSKQIKIAE